MTDQITRRIELERKSKTELCQLWRTTMARLGRRQIFGSPPERWRREEIAAVIAEMEAGALR